MDGIHRIIPTPRRGIDLVAQAFELAQEAGLHGLHRQHDARIGVRPVAEGDHLAGGAVNHATIGFQVFQCLPGQRLTRADIPRKDAALEARVFARHGGPALHGAI